MSSLQAYAPPVFPQAIELDLSRNEGRRPRYFPYGKTDPEVLSKYPDLSGLQATLAQKFGVAPGQVLVTAGGDDALLRCCLATLGPGKRALLTTPTFEMIPRYIEQAKGELIEVPWEEGVFPREDFVQAGGAGVAVAFVVSPNNPTGAVATPADLVSIAKALPDTLVVLDAAYGEFAEDDPTPLALEQPNVVVVRTLSKAWGLAGLRVGYAIGPVDWIERLGAVGNPFPVSSASAELAFDRLAFGASDMADYLRQAKVEREELARRLRRLGAVPSSPNESNFLLVRKVNAGWLRGGLASQGIAVRVFPDAPLLKGAVRITVPGNQAHFERLTDALEKVMDPEALLFDMDGVLADVSGSYRQTMLATTKSFGLQVSAADVDAVKARGNANCDWLVTWTLLREAGYTTTLDEVMARFEQLYQGTPGQAGFREAETLLVEREQLAQWAQKLPLGIVTGRPRKDALRFLNENGIGDLFPTIVCREDAALKPSPEPLALALQKLGISRAWFVGDTKDDVDAARAALVIPVGVIAPGVDAELSRSTLVEAGAAIVLNQVADLGELLQWA